MSTSSTAQISFTLPAQVGIFWDVENAPLKASLSGIEAVNRIREAILRLPPTPAPIPTATLPPEQQQLLPSNSQIVVFRAYSPSSFTSSSRTELASSGITLIEISATSTAPDASNEKERIILTDIFSFLLDHRFESNIFIVLITNTIGSFAYPLSIMRNRGNKVVLALPGRIKGGSAKDLVDFVLDWDGLVTGKVQEEAEEEKVELETCLVLPDEQDKPDDAVSAAEAVERVLEIQSGEIEETLFAPTPAEEVQEQQLRLIAFPTAPVASDEAVSRTRRSLDSSTTVARTSVSVETPALATKASDKRASVSLTYDDLIRGETMREKDKGITSEAQDDLPNEIAKDSDEVEENVDPLVNGIAKDQLIESQRRGQEALNGVKALSPRPDSGVFDVSPSSEPLIPASSSPSSPTNDAIRASPISLNLKTPEKRHSTSSLPSTEPASPSSPFPSDSRPTTPTNKQLKIVRDGVKRTRTRSIFSYVFGGSSSGSPSRDKGKEQPKVESSSSTNTEAREGVPNADIPQEAQSVSHPSAKSTLTTAAEGIQAVPPSVDPPTLVPSDQAVPVPPPSKLEDPNGLQEEAKDPETGLEDVTVQIPGITEKAAVQMA